MRCLTIVAVGTRSIRAPFHGAAAQAWRKRALRKAHDRADAHSRPRTRRQCRGAPTRRRRCAGAFQAAASTHRRFVRVPFPYGAAPFRDRQQAGRQLAAASSICAPSIRSSWVCRGAASRSPTRWPGAGRAARRGDRAQARRAVPARVAIGAIGEDGVLLVDAALATSCGLDGTPLDALVARERAELERRARGASAARSRRCRWRAGRSCSWTTASRPARPPMRRRSVLRRRGAARIVLARAHRPAGRARAFRRRCRRGRLPRASRTTSSPSARRTTKFAQTSDEEVVELLHAAADATPTTPWARAAAIGCAGATGARRDRPGARGHARRADRRRGRRARRQPVGAAGRARPSRCSPTAAARADSARATCRSRACCRSAGLATLLFDLLTEREALRPRERVRHRPARPAAARRDAIRRGGRSRSAGPRRRLLRRVHRAAAALCAAAERRGRDRRGRVARRPARPGGGPPGGGDGADAARRRRPGSASCSSSTSRPPPSCAATTSSPSSRRDAPVRGARRARAGRATRRRLVRRVPRVKTIRDATLPRTGDGAPASGITR